MCQWLPLREGHENIISKHNINIELGIFFWGPLLVAIYVPYSKFITIKYTHWSGFKKIQKKALELCEMGEISWKAI